MSKTDTRRKLKLYAEVLERREKVLEVISADLQQTIEQGGKVPLDCMTIAVDWSEIHAFVCASGVNPNDPLYQLFEGGAAVVNGAHQAALSFLFHGIQTPKLLLPPHVGELQDYIATASEYASIRTVDAEIPRKLAQQMSTNNEVFAPLLARFTERYEKLKAQRDGKPPSQHELALIIDEADAKEKSELQEFARRAFNQGFLFVRWLSVEALQDLRLLFENRGGDPPQVYVINGHPDMRELRHRNPLRSHEYNLWQSEVPKSQMKSKHLSNNDGRTIAELAWLQGELALRGRQLIFVSRGEDINAVFKNHPEWFSCIGDAYNPKERAAQLTEVPSIQRNWEYFYHLGALGTKMDLDQMRLAIDRVRESTASLLQSVNEVIHDDIAKGFEPNPDHDRAANRLEQWIRTEQLEMEQVSSLCSAQAPSIDVERSIRRAATAELNSGIGIVAVLTCLIDPDAFQEEREELRQRLAPAVQRLTIELPQLSFRNRVPSARFKSLVCHVIQKSDPNDWVEGIRDDALRGSVCKHLQAIADLEPPPPEGLPINTGKNRAPSPDECLAFAIRAFAFHDFLRPRVFLLNTGALPELNGGAKRLGGLVLADCALLETSAPRRVDQLFERWMPHDWPEGHPARLAVLNAQLGMELDDADKHGEQPYLFRWSSQKPSTALEAAYKRVRSVFAEQDPSSLPPRLRSSVLNTLVYAASRLSIMEEGAGFGEDDQQGEIYINDKQIRKYADQLKGMYKFSEVHYRDTVAYFKYRVAMQAYQYEGAKESQVSFEDARALLGEARELLEQAKDHEAEAHRQGQGDRRSENLIEDHRRLVEECLERSKIRRG